MPETNSIPEVAKWRDLYPASLKEKPASFSDCLLAITSRFRSFFRKITQDVKPVWITGTVTGISKYQEDRWYVDLRGPEDAYIKAIVNPKLSGIEVFNICDALIIEGKFAFISRPNHLDQIQIQIEVLRSTTIPSKVDFLKRTSAKKTKPGKIQRIGIITSPNGKALSDFRSGFGEYLLRDISVEVEEVELGKSRSILERIQEADAKGYDVLVITRGGGIDLDLFNLPTMVEALRQCKSFTLSALGHADDDMIFDLNADMACSTPTAAGNELQKHINISRKGQRNTGWTPIVQPKENATGQRVDVAKVGPTPTKSAKPWISRLEDFNKSLWRWTSALWTSTWIALAALTCITILLYLLQNCALPAAKTGKAIWDQVHANKPKVISAGQQQLEKKNQGKELKRSSP